MSIWKISFIVLLAGLWYAALNIGSHGLAADAQAETLRGLPGVWVVVEHVSPELEQAGVTQSVVQRDAEAKLRQAGIRVLNQEECWQTPGMPWLYMTVALLKASETTYAATIGATLNQEVQLTRNPQLKAFGATWDAGIHIGAIGTERVASVGESVGSLVDRFIAAYHAVNPQPTGD
jgi:hypothetical protein